MKKSFFIVLVLTLIVSVSLAFTKRDDLYKNLKILPKDITQKQMDSVMNHFTVSLGVACKFCHVGNEEKNEWDYASDNNKHKLIARDMMEMTNAINDKYFDYTGKKRDLNTQLMVTCYTCHNGQKMPATEMSKPKSQKAPWDAIKRN